MRFYELNEDGRIVKGVNTTVDVGPNEIPKQAKKFGNSVDKDGVPPTLSKKVKGKSTNVLFNLGLAEGYKLKLERDKNIDVLHIVDTKTKKRIEVRGKKNYETNYDPNDKLHQVLDKVGKAANISELMNGEVVGINPKHPKGPDAEKTAKDILTTESLDNIYESVLYYRQMKENLGEIAEATEIYIDMDGVLADFFGEWAKLMDKDHWTKINDFPDALQKIRDTEKFWLDLPILPQAKQLLALIKQLKGEYNICSTPLADDPKSEPHKREWIKKNLAFFPPKNIYITHDKPQYATQSDGTPNILIDDYGKNVNEWESAGGIGFKYKDHKFERTAKEIKKHMQEPVESYTRKQLPQLRQKNLKNISHTMEWVRVEDLIPVQEERILENFKRQVDRIAAGKYNPIIVDCNNKIVNGHHRYEAAKLMGYNEMAVAKLPFTIKQIVENFADGKKKGKSRPGRVKRSGASCKGSVTSLRKKAKTASGEKAKMYHWCANMKSGRKKK